VVKTISERWIYALLIYTACVWGANVVILKIMTNYFGIVHLSAIRMWVAFLCMAVICRLKGQRVSRPMSWSDLGWLTGAAALMIYAHQLLLSQGLAWSTATNGALILGLNPVLSVLVGAALFGEQLNSARVGGVMLGLVGAAIVVLNRTGAELRFTGMGDVFLLASMLAYVAAGASIRQIVNRLHPMVIGYYMHLIGAVMLTLHAAFTPSFWVSAAWLPNAWVWALILFSGLFSTAIGNLAWNYGISRLGLGRTSMFINLLPISGLLFAVAFLGVVVKVSHLLGFICVLSGTWLAVKRPEIGLRDSRAELAP
jgi:drug/metabolite transporter (DMT)-like permease